MLLLLFVLEKKERQLLREKVQRLLGEEKQVQNLLEEELQLEREKGLFWEDQSGWDEDEERWEKENLLRKVQGCFSFQDAQRLLSFSSQLLLSS